MLLSNTLEKTPINTVKEFRHDLLLNFSEDYLFNGTDRTNDHPYVELPYPIHEPLRASDTDAVKQLLKEKSDYLKLLASKRKKYKSDEKVIVKEQIGGSNYIYLPRHLLEFYKNKNPDIYFNCDYNFYYTGGVLEYLQTNDSDCLIRPVADKNLCLTDLRNPGIITKLHSDCETPIFGINSIKDGNDHLLVLREKHEVTVSGLENTQEISKIWTRKYHVPVLDAKLNQKKSKHLGVILSNLKLNITDITTKKTIFRVQNDNNRRVDNFQQFRFLDENLIVLIDRFVLKIIDYRANSTEIMFDPHLIDCNTLCNFGILGDDVLLSSRHYLMKADLRNLKKVSHFSHSHSSPPCYIDFATKDADTFLCLASQSEDNKTLFTGHSIYSLPYKVPGIHDTLKECRLRNSNLVLIDSLEERLKFYTAGLKVINLDNEVFIYWSNSLGEIFRQKVHEDEPERTITEPIDKLHKWVNELEKPSPILHVTNIAEMSEARFSLNYQPVKRNLDRYTLESKAGALLENLGPRYSRKNVTSNLAKDFLAVWDSEEDEEEEDSERLLEVPSHDKVNNWIQKHDFSDDENSFGFLNQSTSSQQ